ncbi:hypothetical protein, partial [Rhizobium leguminosarum]|uniref:hypothetical protein n=1 Tax=Rhizobium leguminosarum TaxID=384 RepID=UPI003F98B752
DATEHQDGLILAVSMESVVKLVAFLTAGVCVIWFLFDGEDQAILMLRRIRMPRAEHDGKEGKHQRCDERQIKEIEIAAADAV